MRVVVTETAEAELEEIAAGIEETNPARAGRIVQALQRGCDGLGAMPRRFRLTPRYEHTGVRRRVVQDYLIFYRIGEVAIEILHIVHGGTDYAVKIFPHEG